ncbi:competence type IV pilus assembly protein ComGB [Enterococcus sp.]|uniref:competence type IV pilus assembly protein ComGB n=1 Tax=Enterococcus sp. TaxID=35783 RepID=UPI0028A20D2B|nr:competence type IV pilus assembly protein ComGB [Enterococcus sp.]
MIRFKKKADKLPRKAAESFLATCTILLESGFSLQESLQVMLRSGQYMPSVIQDQMAILAQGRSLAQAVENLQLTASEINQLYLAETHGNLIDTLRRMVDYQVLFNKQKQLLQKTILYPALLLVFVFSALFGMRSFLLPQLLASGMIDGDHWGIRLVEQAPIVLLGFVLLIVVLWLLAKYIFSRKTAIEKAEFFSRMPLFGSVYRCWQTSFFALEWGKLFRQGLEINQIIVCMKETNKATLIQELAIRLEQTLEQGGRLTDQLEQYHFLTPEFALIVFQGEIKGRLGEELFVYSQLLSERVFERVEKTIQWIQPVIFLFVALLIVGIYAAMFLPIYGNIQGVIE